MTNAGLDVFKKRNKEKSARVSYEQKEVKLANEYEDKIRINKKALDFFKNLAPSYKKASIHWVMSAKKKETQPRRLDILIHCSESGKKIPPL